MAVAEKSIHGRILLRISDSYAWRDDWLSLVADLPDDPAAASSGTPDTGCVTVEVNGCAALDMGSAREVMDQIHVTPTGVIDERYGVEVTWRGERHLVLNCTKPVLEWAMPSFLLAGLRSGCVFMHGAAIERDGLAWVFPSWGGIGKTALVASMVRSHGWRVLGDDFVILDGEGQCHAFPKPMVLYPYHRPLFPEVFSSGRGPAAPVAMNAALSRAAVGLKPVLRRVPGLLQWARRNNPQSVRVLPSEVFGCARMAESGKLAGAVFLERVTGLAEPKLEAAGERLAGRVYGTTLSEFDVRCMTVCNIAVGSGHLSPHQFHLPWMRLLEDGLRGKPQFILRLPAHLPVERVVDTVLEHVGTWMNDGGPR